MKSYILIRECMFGKVSTYETIALHDIRRS